MTPKTEAPLALYRPHLLGWGENLPPVRPGHPDGPTEVRPCDLCGAPFGSLHQVVTMGEDETLARLSGEAAASSEARLMAALREEQDYATALGDALLAMGHHAFAKHEAPTQYDGESGRACAFPACLAALQSPAGGER